MQSKTGPVGSEGPQDGSEEATEGRASVARDDAAEHTGSVTEVILVEVGVIVRFLHRPPHAVVRALPDAVLTVGEHDASVGEEVEVAFDALASHAPFEDPWVAASQRWLTKG